MTTGQKEAGGQRREFVGGRELFLPQRSQSVAEQIKTRCFSLCFSAFSAVKTFVKRRHA